MRVSRRQVLSVAGAAVVAGGCLEATPERAIESDELLTMAHRGSMYLWPENTLFAIENAIETGADIVEIDLDVAADGTIVIFHDETLDRTTDGEGPVAEKSVAELKSLDAGYNFPPEKEDAYAGTDLSHDHTPPDESHPFRGDGIEIPTLVEVFEAVPSEYPLLLDVKRNRPSPERIAELVVEYDRVETTLIGAFETVFLERMRQAMGELDTGLGAAEVRQFLATTRRDESRYESPGKFFFAPHRTVRASFVDRAHRNGLSVFPWTVNAPPEMTRLIDANVDGILTDDHLLLDEVADDR